MDRTSGRLLGRVRRYTRVGGAAGTLGLRVALDRLRGRETDRAALAGVLGQLLGGLKGPVMKVAQLLAALPGVLPRELAAELATLQSAAPPMGRAFVRRRMAMELGPDWQRHFAHFAFEAAAAASLGQVHRARDREGRALAVKLQYPDMASVIAADLRQLDLLLALLRRYEGGIDPRELRAELEERLHEELDYAREARHIRLFGHILRQVPDVRVPGVRPTLSSARLLTMEWLEGRPLIDFADAPEATRTRLATGLFRAWYLPLYRAGVLHGDPHPGNYTVAPSARLNLLDFGCVRIFSPRFVAAVIALYRALAEDDRERAVAAYESWGFRGLSRAQIEALNVWARFLYEPLLDDRRRLIGDPATPMERGAAAIAEVRRRLAESGPVTPPRAFVLMDRSALGLGGIFLRLGAKVNWHRLFEELIADFSPDALAARQREALAAAGLAPPDARDRRPARGAQEESAGQEPEQDE